MLKYNMGGVDNTNELFIMKFPHIQIVANLVWSGKENYIAFLEYMKEKYINIDAIVEDLKTTHIDICGKPFLGLELTASNADKIKKIFYEKLSTIESGKTFLCVANNKAYLCQYKQHYTLVG